MTYFEKNNQFFKRVSIIVCLLLFTLTSTYSQKFYPNFKYNVFTIEKIELAEDTINHKVFEELRPFGTGFFIGQSPYFKNRVFLVTAKHVLNHVLNVLDGELIIRLPYEDSVKYPKLGSIHLKSDINSLDKKFILFPKDTCYDVAVIEVSTLEMSPLEIPEVDTTKFRIGMFVVSLIKNINDTIRVGVPVITSGYPFGLSGKYRNYLIFRFGIVSAVIEDEYEGLCGKHYLVNTETIGGDSGSPVFTFPMSSYETSQAKLIGVHKGSFFTGLSIVEPIEVVMEMVDEFLKTNGQE